MSDNNINPDPPEKVSAEELTLRAQPKPVMRLNRKFLIGLTGASILVVVAATFYALSPPNAGPGTREELYNIGTKERAAELADLPSSYRDYKGPNLGAPLPGEFGEAVLRTEQRAGLEPYATSAASLPFRSDPLTDVARAERIRLAQRARQARESTVFFQIARRSPVEPSGAEPDSALSNTAFTFDPVGPGNDLAVSAQSGNGPVEASQGRKLSFLNESPESALYNPHQLQEPISAYQVMAGTVIAASLITGINSDLPGRVIAQVTIPVYDTVTGNHMLIPQGTRLIGEYDSLIAFGQERALVVWQRMILPDGSSIPIDNLPATDAAGYAGLEDKVDFHTWRLIKGIALSTFLSVGAELAFDDDDSDLLRAVRRGSQDSFAEAGQEIVERNLNIQPTITIRPGWPLRVIVHKDIILRPFIQ